MATKYVHSIYAYSSYGSHWCFNLINDSSSSLNTGSALNSALSDARYTGYYSYTYNYYIKQAGGARNQSDQWYVMGVYRSSGNYLGEFVVPYNNSWDYYTYTTQITSISDTVYAIEM